MVQLLYGLSFSSFSESFTTEMNTVTRDYMTRLLYTEDCRLVSLLLLDCRILVEVVHNNNSYCRICCLLRIGIPLMNWFLIAFYIVSLM